MNARCLISSLILFAPALLGRQAAAQETPLHGETVLKFASVEEGRAALTQRDLFVRSMSRYDKQARLGTTEDVADEEYFRFVSAAVEAWPEKEVEALIAAADSIRKRLEPYRVPFPKTVLLVRTSGQEEGGAAYCRGNAVVLPGRLVSKYNAADLERLLLHELFHVLSSHNPELRKSLYAIIGFKPSPGIDYPKSLRDRKITNPDAPTLDYHIEVVIDGELKAAVPILYTSQEKYQPEAKGTFFKHMLFKLMLVEQVDGRWRPVEVDGRAVVFDPRTVKSFMDQIGGNTNYIIHPDEILADNFVHLALASEKLATPRIVSDMKKLLAAKP
jgi:hypothetical protein